MKFASVFIAMLAALNLSAQSTPYASHVNPFIGTGGTGHTFPGAVLPFGMVQLSPDTRIDGSWEGCSGYYFADSVIYGFSHTHLSGTGVSDYGDILLMPTTSDVNLSTKSYKSSFSHTKETASAGYYSVQMNNNIKAELTATTRTGIHRYTFPKGSNGALVLDLLHRDKTLSSNLKVVDSVTVIGYRVSEAWAREQYVYFMMKFSKPLKTKSVNIIKRKATKADAEEQADGAVFQFDLSDGKPLIVKVGISQTDAIGAAKNLNTEATHWDFDLYKAEAEKAWEKQLSKIEVTTPDKEKMTLFYTALYHTMTHPSVASDVDGRYRGRNQKLHQATGFTPYTVFSLWDTFRALNPLMSIVEKKRTTDFINSFLHQYDESKRLPVWELSANETDCMIGFHSVSVIADAFSKNIGGFDTVLIYEAMKAASNYNGYSIPTFNSNYYLEVGDESESVSKTLEYAYDNWCIGEVAKKLNKKSDYLVFSKRAQAYKNAYNKKTGFMQPRKNGNWLSPFEPREVSNHYTEANAWQYTFFVPQDIDGLMRLMGGDKAMEKKLDELFTTSSQTLGREQPDITGLIGQYAHGNEPSHHMAYLYNFVGKPYKTQEKTYKILTEFYKNAPDGLIGNEDCGQMSAWYVLSSMGFYQVCPGLPEYSIGSPLFDKVVIHTDSIHAFTITRQNGENHLQYIKSMSLNGKEQKRLVITHDEIINNGKVEFTMQDKADSTNTLGKPLFMRPHTRISAGNLVISPSIQTPAALFTNSVMVNIEAGYSQSKLYYTLNGQTPTKRSTLYTGAFKCDTSLTIKAIAYEDKDSSSVTVSHLLEKPNNWKVTLVSKYSNPYTAGGDVGIIDGQRGTTNWRSGEWQGYQGQDFECIIDMGKSKAIESVTSGYLQDTRSWIIYPKKVEYYVSEDGKNFKPFGSLENGIPADDYSLQVRSFTANVPVKVNARYVKVKAINFGKLPEWHLGKGGEAFIFVDEIEVK
jgi:predicted alpha-1,2-mannosidase